MDVIVVIIDQFTKMIRLKATTTSILLEGIAKELPKSTETTFGNYMEYQGKSLVTKDHSLHQNL